MIQELRLIRECFPNNWHRKIPLLLAGTKYRYYRYTANHKKLLLGICITKGKRITLLCVNKPSRRKGIASMLVKKSNGITTYTYRSNPDAIRFWESIGFKLTHYEYGLLGCKAWLKKQRQSIMN